MPAVFDHILFFVVAVAQPILGHRSFQKLVRFAAAGHEIPIRQLYNRILIGQWLLFVLVLSIWHSEQRAWADLGFALRTDAIASVGVALAALAFVMLALKLRQLDPGNVEVRNALLDRLGTIELILPRTRGQLRHFYAVSATAGIVEEALWRGFMIWYFAQYLPPWAAVILSSVGFGLAHAYQGMINVPKSALTGAVFAMIYLLTGSLLFPILLHALADALQGRAVYRLLRARRADSDTGLL